MEMRSQDFDIVALFNQGLDEHNAGNLSAAKKMYHEILRYSLITVKLTITLGLCLLLKMN